MAGSRCTGFAVRTQPLGNSAFEEFGIRRRRSKSVPRLLPLEDEKGSTESLARWERGIRLLDELHSVTNQPDDLPRVA